MRKEKECDLGDKKIQVYELKVSDYRAIFERLRAGINPENGLDIVQRCSSLSSVEAFEGLTPSELEQVWSDFLEVNADFLSRARQAGILDLLESYGNLIRSILTDAFAPLLQTGMETLLNTASASFSSAQKKPENDTEAGSPTSPAQ